MRFDGDVTGDLRVPWTIVVPVKHLSAAKSRMGDAGFAALDELAMAFFQDTVTAGLACDAVERVVVATSDDRVAAWSGRCGCVVFDDARYPGINPAVNAASANLRGPVAVLVSDLPCATPDSLARALRLACQHRTAFLSDAAGTGTTLWTRLREVSDAPHFGDGSRAAHVHAGAADLARLSAEATDLERMRRDVDTVSDLQDALRLGVGEFTAATLAGVDVL